MMNKQEAYDRFGIELNEGESLGEERVIDRCKCSLCRRQVPIVTEAHLKGELSIMRGQWCLAEIAVACRKFDKRKARWMKRGTRVVFKTHRPTGTFEQFIDGLSKWYDKVLANV